MACTSQEGIPPTEKDVTSAPASANSGTSSPPMSKKAMKRAKKFEERKQKMKERKRLKKEQKKRQREEELSASITKKRALEDGDEIGSETLRKKPRLYKIPKEDAVRIVIDCSFDSLMSDKELSSLVSQIGYSYSANTRSENPARLIVTSFTGLMEERIRKQLTGFDKWVGTTFESRHVFEAFDKKDIVYLSSESPNPILTLDPSKAYIIGGLVDHNHHKGLTHKQAVEHGVATARLPIDEFVKLSSRKVLAVNHVVEILLHYLQSGDWKDAFLKTIPQRKGITAVDSSQILPEISKNEQGEDSTSSRPQPHGQATTDDATPR